MTPCWMKPSTATLRCPGLKVKLLVGPTCKILRNPLKGAVHVREYGDHLSNLPSSNLTPVGHQTSNLEAHFCAQGHATLLCHPPREAGGRHTAWLCDKDATLLVFVQEHLWNSWEFLDGKCNCFGCNILEQDNPLLPYPSLKGKRK